MEARLIGYNLEKRQVEFEKPDGKIYSYPLVDLSLESKLDAVTSPEFSDAMVDFEIPPKLAINLLMGYCLVVVVITLLAGLPGFWGAARLLTGESDFLHHLRSFGKLMLANIGFTLVQCAVSGYAQHLQRHPEENIVALLLSGLASLALGIASLVVNVIILKRHYDISNARSVGILLLAGLFGALISFVIYAGAGAWIYATYRDTPALLDRLLIDLILKPAGLV